MPTSQPFLTRPEIERLLPHREPFLFLDQVLNWSPGVSATGVKEFAGTEPFLRGHFPERPIVPGVLIIEALGQTLYVLDVLSRASELPGAFINYLGSANVRFLKPVGAGDRVLLNVEINKLAATGVVAAVKAQVNNAIVAAGEMVLIRQRLQQADHATEDL